MKAGEVYPEYDEYGLQTLLSLEDFDGLNDELDQEQEQDQNQIQEQEQGIDAKIHAHSHFYLLLASNSRKD